MSPVVSAFPGHADFLAAGQKGEVGVIVLLLVFVALKVTFALMASVSSLPVNPVSVVVKLPMINADFLITFSFGCLKPPYAAS